MLQKELSQQATTACLDSACHKVPSFLPRGWSHPITSLPSDSWCSEEFLFIWGKVLPPLRTPGGTAELAALLLYLEEIPVYSPSGPALGSICNNIKCICLVLYVNLQRLIAGSLEGQETIYIFRLTQKNQLECQFFKTLPWPLGNVCWIFHEYNIKIIHHCLKKKKINLIATGLNIHLINTKTCISEQSSKSHTPSLASPLWRPS